ncbi:glycosyltransferase family 25 protein [Apiospora arundinis]|uniref:Glycosyltransferase family 25 protein n=1 Tax=Apiospora arundinis TaxID=335852 RepID=A0ABR2HQD4_9PEZI
MLVFVGITIFIFWTPRANGAPSLLRLWHSATPRKPYGREYHKLSSPDEINRVTNETLGFSKIFVIGLPERTDKRDALVLTSSLTGFSVEFVDGVRGDSVPEKAIPFGQNKDSLPVTYRGSWRSHMNVVRSIIEQNLESALIMEDDMDWDVRLLPQLEKAAQGTRTLLQSGSNPHSPYGDDWDVLWLGHCGEIFSETLPENEGKPLYPKFLIKNDETVPPFGKVTGLVDFKAYPEFTRFIHTTGAPICSFAYALSRRGAQKVLFDLSVDRLDGHFDNALGTLCRNGASRLGDPTGLNAKCLTITPPLFFHHRPKGRVDLESDINDVGGDGQVREKGTTENIVWSARNNIRNMLTGREMDSQI